VTLRVYNVAGQLVRTLVDEAQEPGRVRLVRWDGDNNTGEAISSGVYFYKLTTESFTKTRKMVLLK
jgi:flagellar hook assembly protein FlgD